MVAHGVTLLQQITFILGRHDPAGIFKDNPDAPPDEYESEAESILQESTDSEEMTIKAVRRIFRRSFEGEPLDDRAITNAAHDIYTVRLRG